MNINPIYLQLAEKYNLSKIKILEDMAQSILVIGEGIVPLRCAGILLNMPELGRIYAETAYDICMEYEETVQEPDYEALQEVLGAEPELAGSVCEIQIRCSHPMLKERRIRIVSLSEAYDRMAWNDLLLEGDVCCFCFSAIHPLAMAERQFIHAYLRDSVYDTVYLLNDMDKVAGEDQQKVCGLLEHFLPGQGILDLQSLETEDWAKMPENLHEKRNIRIREYIKEWLLLYLEQIKKNAPDEAQLNPDRLSHMLDEVRRAVMKYCRTFPLENLQTHLTGELIGFHSALQRDLAAGIEEESDTKALKGAIPGYLFGEWEEFLQGTFSAKMQEGLNDLAAECENRIGKEARSVLPEKFCQRMVNFGKIREVIKAELPEYTPYQVLSYAGAQIGKSGRLSKQELLTEGKKISARTLADATEGMENRLKKAEHELEICLESACQAVWRQAEEEFRRKKGQREETEVQIRELERDLRSLK